ncbi:uncharacterized protein LOC132677018 isoform X2 [Panthera onca]
MAVGNKAAVNRHTQWTDVWGRSRLSPSFWRCCSVGLCCMCELGGRTSIHGQKSRHHSCLVRSVDNFLSISQLRPLRSSYLPTVTDWAASCPCVPSCLAQNGGAPGLSAGPASRGRHRIRSMCARTKM